MKHFYACFYVLVVYFLVACQQQPSAGSHAWQDGQETHGGDIVVAMVRGVEAKLANQGNEDGSFRAIRTFDGGSQQPFYRQNGEWIEYNRSRMLPLSVRSVRGVLENRSEHELQAVEASMKHWKGDAVTPTIIKERASVLFNRMSYCLETFDNGTHPFMSESFLTIAKPILGAKMENFVSQVNVVYSPGPLVDSKSGRRVDMGVKRGTTDTIFLDPELVAQWSTNNFAVDLLIFHEYSHLLRYQRGEEDSDYAWSSKLFLACTLGGITDLNFFREN